MNNSTLLIVDDSPHQIELFRQLLGEEYRIKVATRGDLALRIAGKVPQPDLILLDVILPDMDGFEVCRQLKANPLTRHIPVLFVTSQSETEDEAQGLALGAVDYLTKPIKPAIVKARIRTHLALHNQEKHLNMLVREQTEELDNTRLEIIRRLGRAAEYKDNETGMHVMRMSHFSRVLAEAAGLSRSQCELILTAAPMHDVGKIGIPDQILTKPGRLNAQEWAVMRRHPVIGAQIIGNHPSPLLACCRTVALTHHEKWDGSGYPNQLKGEDIPIEGRIVAVADVFDALTSERPYKHAWPLEDALDLLKAEAGKHFDPELVPLFLQRLPEILDIQATYSDKSADVNAGASG